MPLKSIVINTELVNDKDCFIALKQGWFCLMAFLLYDFFYMGKLLFEGEFNYSQARWILARPGRSKWQKESLKHDLRSGYLCWVAGWEPGSYSRKDSHMHGGLAMCKHCSKHVTTSLCVDSVITHFTDMGTEEQGYNHAQAHHLRSGRSWIQIQTV